MSNDWLSACRVSNRLDYPIAKTCGTEVRFRARIIRQRWAKCVVLDERLAVSALFGGLSRFRIQPNCNREPTLPPARAVIYKETCHGNVPSLSKLAWMAAFQKSRSDA
jgi:hypothetical protein